MFLEPDQPHLGCELLTFIVGLNFSARSCIQVAAQVRLNKSRELAFTKFHKSDYAICYNMTLTDPLNCLRSTGTYLQVGNWVGLLRNLRSSQPAATM